MSYIIFSVLVLGFSLFYDYLKIEEKITKGVKVFFYLVICLLLCGFAGLRTNYNDSSIYAREFIQHTPDKFSNIFATDFKMADVYIFQIWRFLIYHFISKNIHVYFFLSAMIFVFPAVHLIDKYSKNFTFSMILFMFGGMYLFSLAGLKQAMATGVVLIGIPFLIKKSYWRYYLCCFVALGLHTYSIFFLILPLLGLKIFNKRTIWFCILVVASGLLLSFFSGVITKLIEFMGKEVAEETIQDGSVNIFRALVFVVPFVLILIANKKLEKDASDAEKVFIKISVLSSIFMVLALFGNPILFGRIPQYFIIGIVVSLPQIIDKVFVTKEKKLIITIACLGYVLFGLYDLYIDGAFMKDIFGLIWF